MKLKVKKNIVFLYVCLCENICTAGGSYYGCGLCTPGGSGRYFCGFDFEDLEEKIGDNFSGTLKMNQCFDTLQNVTAKNAGTWCFCDSDGCNGSGLTQLSLSLLSLVAMRFAF